MPLNIGPRCGPWINDILISEHTGPSLGPRQKRELAKSSNFPPADPGPGGGWRELGPATSADKLHQNLSPTLMSHVVMSLHFTGQGSTDHVLPFGQS